MEALEPTKLQDLLEKHRLWAAGDAQGARLTLRSVSLAGFALSQADFSRALLQDVDFSGAELRYAGFTGAQLERVLFQEAVLEGASFLEARLTDCSFERARFAAAEDVATGPKAEAASGADFQRAQLKNVTFSESVLRGADLSDARLEIVTFDRADLRRADFVASQVSDSSFVDAQLGESVLAKASFRNVTLRGAKLRGARLRRWSCRGRCDLAGADLSRADLDHAGFELVDLRGAFVEDAKWIKTRIRTAYVHGTHGLPFVYDVSRDAVFDFSEQADGSERAHVLRLAKQLGDESGRARFGSGVGAACYRCRTLAEPFVIESVQPALHEAIRVLYVGVTALDGLSTLRVEYELLDDRFRDSDPLAHELIFELVLRGALRDHYAKLTDAACI